jgi:uncharacterized protein YdcH (DUF465 family)
LARQSKVGLETHLTELWDKGDSLDGQVHSCEGTKTESVNRNEMCYDVQAL